MTPFGRLPRVGASLGIVVALLAMGFAMLVGIGGASSVTPSVATPYSVTFEETGLPAGTNWSVHVGFVGCSCDGVYRTGTTNQSNLTIAVTNGTYRYHVLMVPGYYVNVGASGFFNITTANLSGISFVFHPLVTYPVTVSETGLPNGTVWSATVTGNGTGQLRTIEHRTATSNTSNLSFVLPNGTYHYAVASIVGSFFLNHSSHGRFVVNGSSPAAVPVRFLTPPLFAVTFTESGLPNGTNWSVRVAGWGGVAIREVLSSTNATITFELPNGTYHFVVSQVMGFVIYQSGRGGVIVTNTPLGVAVGYRQVVPGAFYPVAFQENGLANGTHWSVTVTILHTFGHSRQATQTSNGSTVFFLLQNNSYRFVVHTPRGYAIAVGGRGNFTINGSSPSVFLVNFTLVPTYTVTITETGLDNATNWSALLRSQTRGSTPWPIHVVTVSNTTTISFTVPNGSYCYRVYAVAGYTFQGMASGSIVVAGGPAGASVTYIPLV